MGSIGETPPPGSPEDIGAQPADSDLTAIAALTTTAFGRAFLALADAAAGRLALGLGTAATHAHGDYDAAGAAAAAQAASQPLDSDLTAIAALTTTAYGRALLALADAAAGRTALGLGTAATQASTAFDAAGAAAAAQAASQPLDSDLTAIAALTTTSFGRALLALADAAAGRTALGLGTASTSASGDFQPVDSDLTAIAALTTTSFGRSLLTQASAGAAKTTLQTRDSFAFAAGTYHGSLDEATTGTRLMVLNRMYAKRRYVPNLCTITSLGCTVSSPGESGAKIRMGVYADSGGYPAARLYAGAQVAADSAATPTDTAINLQLGPGWYWFTAVAQSFVTTGPTVTSAAGADPAIEGSSMAGAISGALGGYYVAGVTGALPDPFGYTFGNVTNNVPLVGFLVGSAP